MEQLMKHLIKPNLCCIRCSCKCLITPYTEVLIGRCEIQKFTVWPGNNNYLIEGLKSSLPQKKESTLLRNIVFVDFSIYNLRYFTNSYWLENLKKTGLVIILVCDDKMISLANFWSENDMSVNKMLHRGSNIDNINEVICSNRIHTEGGENKRIVSLNENEMKFLDLTFQGCALSAMPKVMSLGKKKVYNIKQSIHRKMGADLHQLICI